MRLSIPSFSIPYPTLTVSRHPSSATRPLRRRNYAPAFRLTGTVLLGILAVLCVAVAAAWEFLQGFVQGFRDARTLPSPEPAPVPTPRAKVLRQYEVICNQDSEVLLNGIPIGHIDSGPWQFCSYTEPPAPARPSKARAFDDACDYAETVARQA